MKAIFPKLLAVTITILALGLHPISQISANKMISAHKMIGVVLEINRACDWPAHTLV